jgi:hypothetical protein
MLSVNMALTGEGLEVTEDVGNLNSLVQRNVAENILEGPDLYRPMIRNGDGMNCGKVTAKDNVTSALVDFTELPLSD